MDYIASSTKLGNCYLKDEGLKRKDIERYQAHHIIPQEIFLRNDKEMKEFYDFNWNCLFLPAYDDAIIHCGSHPDYTKYISRLINMYKNQKNCTFYEAAVEVANAVRTWYNDVTPLLRMQQIYEISINYINNLEEFTGVSVRNYIKQLIGEE